MINIKIDLFIFVVVVLLAVLFDLGIFKKKKSANIVLSPIGQTILWMSLAMLFGVRLYFSEGMQRALEYTCAYFMEWSLSIDNIFVFLIIFNTFKIPKQHSARVLFIGVLLAIVFRLLFIAIGIELVQRFSFVMYFFGLMLLYSGYKMLRQKKDDNYNPVNSRIYKWIQKFVPLSPHNNGGKFFVIENGGKKGTVLFVVVIFLAVVDVIFAVDSIPAVLGISNNYFIIYTSNIFAVLGLRSLFFLLQNISNKFKHLQKAISVILIFVGIKILLQHLIHHYISAMQETLLSFGVIFLCIGVTILISVLQSNKKKAHHF